ncbi:hypothetical protein V8G54_033127 [Vigna mungo]|uniref:non-specific serine/threonine protein kinase n=1 Tax=Vigna mungo TaxID=3915 RepID=A0AAQ3MNS2_VIGMU
MDKPHETTSDKADQECVKQAGVAPVLHESIEMQGDEVSPATPWIGWRRLRRQATSPATTGFDMNGLDALQRLNASSSCTKEEGKSGGGLPRRMMAFSAQVPTTPWTAVWWLRRQRPCGGNPYRGQHLRSGSCVGDLVDREVKLEKTWNGDPIEPAKNSKSYNLNAFDISSYSSGFDLSGLFEETDRKKEARFTSHKLVPIIIFKLEEICKRLRLKLKNKDGGLFKLEGSKVGRKGPLGIDAKIFEITPVFHLVELKKSSGDTLEYQKLLNQEVRSALKDVVWNWQGEAGLSTNHEAGLLKLVVQP